MSYFDKRPRSDCEIELRTKVERQMKATGRWVWADAKEAVLRLDPALAARVDAETKGRTPR